MEKLHDSQKEMLLCTKFPYSKEERLGATLHTILVPLLFTSVSSS